MKTILKVLTLIFCSLFLLLSIFSIFNICTQKYKLEYETWFDTKMFLEMENINNTQMEKVDWTYIILSIIVE